MVVVEEEWEEVVEVVAVVAEEAAIITNLREKKHLKKELEEKNGIKNQNI